MLSSLLISCSFLDRPKLLEPRQLTLIYSGNLDGELEPCGCSLEGDFGGILRRATVLDQFRKENKELVVISAGGLLSNRPAEHDKLTAEYILKGFSQLNYDAIGFQWQDLAYGKEFLTVNLPWVVSNWQGKFFSSVQKIQRKSATLSFFSWLDPKQSPFQSMSDQQEVVNDSIVLLEQKLKQAKKLKETTIVTTTLTLDAAKLQLPMQWIDILIAQAAYEEYGEPRWAGSTLILTPGSRGMRLGRLKVIFGAEGNIAEFSHDVIAMPQTVEDATRLSGWYSEYNQKIEKNYQKEVEVSQAQQQGESPYVGAKVCKTCHQSAYDFWKKSRHSKAYRSLSNVNKSFDPACISCHVVGYRKSGGFIASHLTKNLKNVQCESCHGAGAAHAKSQGVTPLENSRWSKEEVCAQCHIQKHSPSFQLSDYWIKVKH